MLNSMFRRRRSGFRQAAARHPEVFRPRVAVAMAIALALAASVASDTRAATSPIESSFADDQEAFQANSDTRRKTSPVTLSSANAAAGEDIAGQIFQSEVVSARSVATFARSVKPFGLLMNESFNPVFPHGGFETGPKGLSGRGLYNTIETLHGPRPARGGWAGNDESASPAANSSASSNALAQFWEQSASADFVFDHTASDGSANGAVTGAENVLIPLPAAAWSALSVMGGVGAFAGIRRMFRRGK
jgi:hypothetical protein